MRRSRRTDDTARYDTPESDAVRFALRASNSMKPADLWSPYHVGGMGSEEHSIVGNQTRRPRIEAPVPPVTAMARVRKAIRGVSSLSNWHQLRSVFHRDGSIGSQEVVADLSVEAFWLRLRQLGCTDDDIAEVAGSFDPSRCGRMSTRELFQALTSPSWRIDPSVKVSSSESSGAEGGADTTCPAPLQPRHGACSSIALISPIRCARAPLTRRPLRLCFSRSSNARLKRRARRSKR